MNCPFLERAHIKTGRIAPPIVLIPPPSKLCSHWPIHFLGEPTQCLWGLGSIQYPSPCQGTLPPRLDGTLSNQFRDVDPGRHRNHGGGWYTVQFRVVIITAANKGKLHVSKGNCIHLIYRQRERKRERNLKRPTCCHGCPFLEPPPVVEAWAGWSGDGPCWSRCVPAPKWRMSTWRIYNQVIRVN